MNEFFMRTTNYFFKWYYELFLIQVLRIIFHCVDNYFSRYSEFIFWPTIHCGLAIAGGMARVPSRSLIRHLRSWFSVVLIFNATGKWTSQLKGRLVRLPTMPLAKSIGFLS